MFINVDTINYTVCKTCLLYLNLCFTVTCFGHHIWPPASSLYELTERIHKRTAPHVLNKMESVMPELSVSNTYYPGIRLFILFRVSCCTVKRVYSICNFIRNALTWQYILVETFRSAARIETGPLNLVSDARNFGMRAT